VTVFSYFFQKNYCSNLNVSSGVEPLVSLLSSTEPEVLRAALKLTIALADEYQARDQFGQLGG
jgi:hypothetical protein